VVEKKTASILSNVLVEAEGDRLSTATDLSWVSAAPVLLKCANLVQDPPARRLLDYVRLLPDSPISIKLRKPLGEPGLWPLKDPVGWYVERYPELPQMPPRLAEIPAGFCRPYLKNSFVISAEESRFTLNGALLVIRPERDDGCHRRPSAVHD
jgi:DNA polymerase-3 subunit beta